MATRIVSDPRSREKPCLRCGYSLRNLFDSRHCPECGLSVWLSLSEGDALERSNPAWLRRLALAAWVLAGAQAIGLGAWLLAGVFGLLPSLSFSFSFSRIPFTMRLLLVAAQIIAAHIGMILLAGHENRYPDRLKVSRRWLVTLGWAGLPVGALLASMSVGALFVRSWYWLLYTLWGWGALLVLLGGVVATLNHLRHLARRAPSPRAGRACLWLMIFPAVLAWPALPCVGPQLFYASRSFIRIIPWIYLPATLALYAWFALMLRRNAALAEREWSTETAPGARTPVSSPA